MKRANFTSSAEQRRYQYILLQRHLAGDPEATEILYSLLTTYLQSHLPNYIRRRSWLLSREDLEEAVSTALHNCSVSFSTFRGEALLTSWAFYYAIHAAGNLHMKNCRYLRHFEWSVDRKRHSSTADPVGKRPDTGHRSARAQSQGLVDCLQR